MGLFGCRGCEARDREIQHLLAELNAQREQTTKVAAQLCEIASPGSTRRAVPPPLIPATTAKVQAAGVPKKSAYNFPGYERPEREDAPEIS